MLDFDKLTNCPEFTQYVSNTRCKEVALFISAFMRIRESSAKSKCETDGAFLHTLTPSMPPTSSSYNKRLDNPSAHNKNKYGDRGSPCRRPLVGVNMSVSSELNRT
jgi:hypothetical protein